MRKIESIDLQTKRKDIYLQVPYFDDSLIASKPSKSEKSKSEEQQLSILNGSQFKKSLECPSISDLSQKDLDLLNSKAEQLFKYLDIDGDGKIHSSDLLYYLQFIGLKPNEKQAQQMIKIGNLLSTSVDLEDFKRIIKKQNLTQQLKLGSKLKSRQALYRKVAQNPGLAEIFSSNFKSRQIELKVLQMKGII